MGLPQELWPSTVRQAQYRLPPDQSKEALLEHISESDGEENLETGLHAKALQLRQSSKRPQIYLLINTCLLIASIIFFALGSRGYMINTEDLLSRAVRDTSYFTPIHKSMKTEMADVHFNGTLYPPAHPSWSRMPPGDEEAEAVWQSFEPHQVFPISRQDVIDLGKDPNTAVKLPDKYFGLGDDAYAASLDVTHKLHCLNELRKMAFVEHPNQPFKHTPGDGTDPEKAKTDAYYLEPEHGKLWWYHLRHCVDMLTQDLICHADADVYVYQYRDTQSNPFPDFAVNRKCRNFDQLLQWRSDHMVDLEHYVEVMKNPRDDTVTQVPYEKEWYEWHGFGQSVVFPDGQGFEEYWEEHWV